MGDQCPPVSQVSRPESSSSVKPGHSWNTMNKPSFLCWSCVNVHLTEGLRFVGWTFTVVVPSEISHQLLRWLPWNLVQTLAIPSGWVLKIFAMLLLFLQLHHQPFNRSNSLVYYQVPAKLRTLQPPLSHTVALLGSNKYSVITLVSR